MPYLSQYLPFYLLAPPAATTLEATDVTPIKATFNGIVEPNGLPTEYWFEHGKTEAYGSQTPKAAGLEEAAMVSALFKGLKPRTAYHFRLVAVNAEGESFGEDIEFTTGKPFRVAVNREFPPAKHCVIVRDPQSGTPIARWAEDEARSHNVMNGLRLSGGVPGGKKELKCTLPRDPRRDWPDQQGFLSIECQLPGRNRVWHGRIGKAPRSDGERMVIDNEAVGYAAALEDRKALRIGFIDSNFGNHGEPSTQRRLDLINAGVRLNAAQGAGWQGAGEHPPGITFDFNDIETISGKSDRGESSYFSGGPDIGALLYHFARLAGGSGSEWTTLARLATNDVNSVVDAGENHKAKTNADAFERLDAGGAGRKYASLVSNRAEGGAGGADLTDFHSWEYPKVLGNNDLSLQGTWPNVGFTVAQMLRYAVPLYSGLQATEESVEDDGFVVSQAWFSDPGTLARIVDELVKLGLYDWFVKDAKLFELRQPGTYGRRWQAYQGPSNFQEAGTDTERAWDRIVVGYQEPNGTTRFVGWPGSGCEVESPTLQITDPDHPAVRADEPREDLLELQVQSSPTRAIEVGERWLAEANELSRSGKARLSGYVQDECGVWYPAAVVAEGDLLRFKDARDKSYRKIVGYDYAGDDLAVDVDLDAPSEDVKALFERFRAVLAPLGLR